MTCIFCDVPRERHTPAQLAECQDMGAQQGWLGLALAQATLTCGGSENKIKKLLPNTACRFGNVSGR